MKSQAARQPHTELSSHKSRCRQIAPIPFRESSYNFNLKGKRIPTINSTEQRSYNACSHFVSQWPYCGWWDLARTGETNASPRSSWWHKRMLNDERTARNTRVVMVRTFAQSWIARREQNLGRWDGTCRISFPDSVNATATLIAILTEIVTKWSVKFLLLFRQQIQTGMKKTSNFLARFKSL